MIDKFPVTTGLLAGLTLGLLLCQSVEIEVDTESVKTSGVRYVCSDGFDTGIQDHVYIRQGTLHFGGNAYQLKPGESCNLIKVDNE